MQNLPEHAHEVTPEVIQQAHWYWDMRHGGERFLGLWLSVTLPAQIYLSLNGEVYEFWIEETG